MPIHAFIYCIKTTFLSLAFCLSFAAWAQNAVPQKIIEIEGVTEYRLENGLRVLLLPDASKPSTTVNLTYLVGSRHENTGETGYAHLLEHMLFKGTPNTPNVWAEFERRGFRANGSTTHDRTNYYATFADSADNLHWFISWLADSMHNSSFTRADLDSEMTVVRNEMERGENDQNRILLHKTLAAAYDWHAYGRATIGARSDVEGADMAKLRAFYQKWYQPQHAVLIVAGKFEVNAILDLIAKKFALVPKLPRAVASDFPTLESPQEGLKTVTVQRASGTPALNLVLHTVAAAHADYMPLMLLAELASKTDTGVLDAQLVKTGLATSSYAYLRAAKEPSYVLFGAALKNETNLDTARQALIKAVLSLPDMSFSATDFELVKKELLQNYVQTLESADRAAYALSEASAVGDWRLFFWQRERLNAIKIEDVQQAAKRWIKPANMTLGIYQPLSETKSENPKTPAPEFIDAQKLLEKFAPQNTRKVIPAFDSRPENLEASSVKSELQMDGKPTLKIGLLKKATAGARINAVLALHFGSEAALQSKTEISSYVAAMLMRGSLAYKNQPARSRGEIENELTRLNATISISGNLNALTARLAMPQENAQATLKLLAQILRAPAFDSVQIEELRAQISSNLKRQSNEPANLAGNALVRFLRPYATENVRYTPTLGEQTLRNANWQAADLRDFHAQFLSAQFGEFSAVGELDVAQMQQALAEEFGDWRSTAKTFNRIAHPHIEAAATRVVIATPGKANAVLLAGLSFAMDDDSNDYVPLLVANQILGGGGNSRLWLRVREKEGLSYGIYSYISVNTRDNNGGWALSVTFAPQNLDTVEAALQEEMQAFYEKGVNVQEIKQAVQGLLAQRQLNRTQDSTLASVMGQNLYWNRDFLRSAQIDARLKNVTPEEVNQVIKRYLDARKLAVFVAGDGVK